MFFCIKTFDNLSFLHCCADCMRTQSAQLQYSSLLQPLLRFCAIKRQEPIRRTLRNPNYLIMSG